VQRVPCALLPVYSSTDRDPRAPFCPLFEGARGGPGGPRRGGRPSVDRCGALGGRGARFLHHRDLEQLAREVRGVHAAERDLARRLDGGRRVEEDAKRVGVEVAVVDHVEEHGHGLQVGQRGKAQALPPPPPLSAFLARMQQNTPLCVPQEGLHAGFQRARCTPLTRHRHF